MVLAWKTIALYKCILNFSNNGGGNLGDVNISALLTSFQTGYDKRVRPNYGGKRYYKSRCFLIIIMDIPVTKKRRKAQLIYVSLFHQEKIREQNSMMEYILFRSILWLYRINAKKLRNKCELEVYKSHYHSITKNQLKVMQMKVVINEFV